MCKIFFTGLFFILWGVDQNSDPVMVLNRFGMMDIGVADECGSTLYFGRSDEVPGNVFQYCSNLYSTGKEESLNPIDWTPI